MDWTAVSTVAEVIAAVATAAAVAWAAYEFTGVVSPITTPGSPSWRR